METLSSFLKGIVVLILSETLNTRRKCINSTLKKLFVSSFLS